MKNIKLLLISIILFINISCNPFGIIKYDLEIDHNLYIGGRTSKIHLKIDDNPEEIIYSGDKKTYSLEKGNHRIKATIYYQKYSTYSYWDSGSLDIELYKDKKIYTFESGLYDR